MASSPLTAEVRQTPGKAVIDLVGEINGTAEQAMNDAYTTAMEGDPGTVILNFENVSYINSTGIALIVSLLARARKEHRQISACKLAEHYKEIFRITRLADFMAMYDDESQALAS